MTTRSRESSLPTDWEGKSTLSWAIPSQAVVGAKDVEEFIANIKMGEQKEYKIRTG